ncbi:Aspartyl/glutamyl-tRNA (Asn/Gln) amidotransferase, subunit C [gamma proteobacterium HdN1]|nr:Aspartyl/glutamyl-tRNA (Asn/Gln) amidotransferase, subunit C [gamma proteobacterium HdN1]
MSPAQTSTLTPEQVRKIAHLARLGISDDQLGEYAQRLGGVLDLVAKLQDAPVGDLAPMAHPLDATQRLRADAVTETNQRKALQNVAPETEDGLYLVPKVIE